MAANARLEQLVDKGYRTWDVTRLPDAPVDALKGVSPGDAAALQQSLQIKTIRDLAENRFVKAALEILALAAAGNSAGVPSTETFPQMLKRVATSVGLGSLDVRIVEEEATAQTSRYPGAVGFEAAFDAALRLILTDDRDSESPVSLIENEWPGDPTNAQKLKDYLNGASAVLYLVGPRDVEDEDHARGVFPPEHGEQLEDYWCFSLAIRELSDHIYWAVIDRADAGRGKVYGFN